MTAEQQEKINRVRMGVADLFTECETFEAGREAYERWKSHAARLADAGSAEDARAAADMARAHGGSLFIRSQSIITRCRAYAGDFHGGDLAAGLADLQAVCDWIAEQGRKAEGRRTSPQSMAELSAFVAVLAHGMATTRPDLPQTFAGFTDAPDVRAVYDAASLHNRLWLAKLAQSRDARAA